MGDFNIDMLKMNQTSSPANFIQQLFSYSFYPLITKPTRITEKSATLIDNILTNRLSDNDLKGIRYYSLIYQIIFPFSRSNEMQNRKGNSN